MIHYERLAAYASEQVGLARDDRVELAPHHPRWKRVFSDEAHFLYDLLRIEQLRLFHCGSTSIPGIAAKPIIDIVGSVNRLAELDGRRDLLEAAGYEYKGEYGIPGRRYAVLYNPEKTASFVHLHLFEHSHPAPRQHRLFRDYLRAQPNEAERYEKLKLDLVQSGRPRSEYSEGKSELISELDQRASQWRPAGYPLVIAGSAPGGANTFAFAKEIVPGNKTLHLNEIKIESYRYDFRYGPEDRFPALVREMITASEVVFATPVYWYAMSGPMKNFLDRFSNLLRGEHKELGEALYGKRLSLVATGADERLPMGFEVPFASTALYLAMDYQGASYRPFP